MALLQDKVAVVYGAAGSIGAAVSRAFAAEGARVFASGPHAEPVREVVSGIEAAGGTADAAVVDALDEEAIEAHLARVVAEAGRIDVSFNAVAMHDAAAVGRPLVDVDREVFTTVLMRYATSFFLTARHAARAMLPNGSGVIMTVSALHSRIGIPLVGGYGPAQAAKESLVRSLSAELAPHGIRVVNLRPQAMPESRTIRAAFEPRRAAMGIDWEGFQALLAGRTHPGRLLALRELADVAAFAASDRASGLTGTTLNLTMGSLDD